MNLRSLLLDTFVPPYALGERGGRAYVAYAQHKSVLIAGRHVCPYIDPLLDREPGPYSCVTLGNLPGPEHSPSVQLPVRVSLLEFFVSLFFWDARDLADYRFLDRLYNQRLVFPKRFRWFHVVRSFLAARYFALKFRSLASRCCDARVVVYYNAMMLGVVRAFHREGKPVWDVQHGYLGDSHPAYNNTEAFAVQSDFRVDGFVVWEPMFGKHLERALGAAWESTDYLHLRAYADRPGDEHRPPVVLYTLDWGSGVPREVEAAVDAIPRISWIFRMHPMDRSPRHDLDPLRARPNVRVVDADMPLAQALSGSALHVTFNSSVVHEAAILNVPSFFFDGMLQARFAKEVGSGHATYVSLDALATALDRFFVQSHPAS